MPNARGMSENKSSISRARSYKELSEFWDSHDLSGYWDQLRPAEFDVDIQSEATYYPLEASLSAELRSIARKKGVSPEVLLNLWVQEKVRKAAK
jgi:hypothetical protein